MRPYNDAYICTTNHYGLFSWRCNAQGIHPQVYDVCLLCDLLILNHVDTLSPRQNGRHFADNIFKCIFLKEKVWIALKISLKFVPMDRINNIPALVQIMAWRRLSDKPLFEPMMVSLLAHISVTRPQWGNKWKPIQRFWKEISNLYCCCVWSQGRV